MGMAGGGPGASRGDLIRLFDGGSVAGLGDGELLGRFAESGDGAAFEALVARHGPMVLGGSWPIPTTSTTPSRRSTCPRGDTTG